MLSASQGSGGSPLPDAENSLDPVRILGRAMVRRPGDYEPMGCLCIYVLVCMCLCVSVCASVSLTSYACLYVLLCMFICVCLCVYMCLCVCVSLWMVYMFVWLFVWESICVCLPVSIYRCGACLGLILRGRGLPVHVDMPVAHLDQQYPVECSLAVAVAHPTKHHHIAPQLASVERREQGDPWRTVTTALSESFASSPIKVLNKALIYRCRNQG